MIENEHFLREGENEGGSGFFRRHGFFSISASKQTVDCAVSPIKLGPRNPSQFSKPPVTVNSP
jgi:hypothetical protein